MKFLEAVYVVGASCFCGLLYVFVASLLGVPSRTPVAVLPLTATDRLSIAIPISYEKAEPLPSIVNKPSTKRYVAVDFILALTAQAIAKP